MSGGKSNKPVAGGTDKDVVKAAEGIKEKSALQKLMEERAQRFFDWDNGTGAYAGQAKDITKAPGMDAALDIYGTADRLAAEKRFTPSVALSGQGSAGFARQQDAQQGMQRYDLRARALSDALAGSRAQAFGLADQSIGNEMQQKQGYANALGQYNSGVYNRPQKPPLWQAIAGMAIGGMSAAGSMGAKF